MDLVTVRYQFGLELIESLGGASKRDSKMTARVVIGGHFWTLLSSIWMVHIYIYIYLLVGECMYRRYKNNIK
jgi:hypothetical protein